VKKKESARGLFPKARYILGFSQLLGAIAVLRVSP
jgi:hypothetical protein